MIDIGKLSWIINNACNLRCIHCYPDSGVERRKEYTDEDFALLLKNFEGMHFGRIFLSGGEPILDKNFYKYLSIAKQYSDEVFMCSNGTTLSENVLDRLVSAGIDGIVLSLQALDEESARKIYGNPCVPQCVFDAIHRIQKYDMALIVETTLLKQNVRMIDKIIEKLIKEGVEVISFKRLLPVGRAIEGEIGISKEENYEMLKKIFQWQVSNKDIRFNVHDPLYGTVIYDYYEELVENPNMLRWLKGFSCRAGTRWIGIDPEGNVSPCPILLYKDILIGNIREQPLEQILNTSPLIETLRRIEQGITTKCKYGSVCLGCRATAIGKTNDFYAQDPMCVHDGNICPITHIKEE